MAAHLVTRCLVGVTVLSGGASEIANVSQVFHPDGLFRFRADGTNERGLAVMKVTTGGGVAVAGSPKSFGA